MSVDAWVTMAAIRAPRAGTAARVAIRSEVRLCDVVCVESVGCGRVRVGVRFLGMDGPDLRLAA